RDPGFEPILERPHMKQAQWNHRGHGHHEARQPLKILEGTNSPCFERSRQLLNS
ncbi:hypothetical protein M9458_010252, partial [Cirrhinus mrigala]